MAFACITGANRGIGLEMARQYHQRGDQVLAVCRSISDELASLDVETIEGVDVTSSEGVARLINTMADRRLDILINNAGLLSNEALEDLDFDRIRRQFEVNSLGPLRVTAGLRNNLGQGSKVAIITSRMGSIADNTSGGRYGYRMSKAAVNMAGVSLALDLRSREIAVALLHPGMVATDMSGGRGISPEQSVRGLIARMDALDMNQTGGFWHADGQGLPW